MGDNESRENQILNVAKEKFDKALEMGCLVAAGEIHIAISFMELGWSKNHKDIVHWLDEFEGSSQNYGPFTCNIDAQDD